MIGHFSGSDWTAWTAVLAKPGTMKVGPPYFIIRTWVPIYEAMAMMGGLVLVMRC